MEKSAVSEIKMFFLPLSRSLSIKKKKKKKKHRLPVLSLLHFTSFLRDKIFCFTFVCACV